MEFSVLYSEKLAQWWAGSWMGKDGTLQMMESVLGCIEVRYPSYFNLDLAVPVTLFRKAVNQVEGKMDVMLSRLKNKSTNKDLHKMVQDSLVYFTKANTCSYYAGTILRPCKLQLLSFVGIWKQKKGMKS